MPRYKVTMGFSNSAFSPTESYISASVSLSNASALVQRLLDARMACLDYHVLMRGVRIGQADSKRRSKFYIPGTFQPFVTTQDVNIPAGGSMNLGSGTGLPDQGRSCLQVRHTYDTDRVSNRYHSFPPDLVLEGEPASYNPSGAPGWSIRLGSFFNQLRVDGWCIRARDYGSGFAQIPIRDWLSADPAPTNAGIVLDAAPSPGIVRGDTVTISNVRRRGADQTSYNGTYRVTSVNATLVPSSVVLFLRGTETAVPASVLLPGTVQKVGYAYFTIESSEAVRAATHKRGNSYGSRPGRRKTRKSLGR